MKLIVVGHSYITAFAQCKYVAMKQLDSNLQIRLVTPVEVGHIFMSYKREMATGLNQEEVVSIREIFGKSHMTYILDPVRLTLLLKKFSPDHIHIEEDPYSLIGLETIFLSRMVCRKAKISFFIWDNLARKPRFPLSFLKWAFSKYTLSRSALVVCGNHEGQRLLIGPKEYHGNNLVLPQVGLNPDEYLTDPPEKLKKQFSSKHDGDEPLIGFLGRLIPEKGIILLLEALSHLQHLSWKLLIVGSGPMKKEIQTRWKVLFNNRLICLDAVSHKAVPDYLKCLDIFVLPSYSTPRWKEQFGLTLAQAMMARVACVGSSSGAIPDVLGPAGIIFQERDAASLINALEQLLQSKEKRDMFGEKGQAFALKNYTNRSVANAYLAAFNNLTNL